MSFETFLGEFLFTFLFCYAFLVIFGGIRHVLPIPREGLKIDFKNND